MLISMVTIVDSDGHVVACETDYSQSKPGGWSVKEAQQKRAAEYAWRAAMIACCNGDMASAINSPNNPGVLHHVKGALLEQGWEMHHAHFDLPLRPAKEKE